MFWSCDRTDFPVLELPELGWAVHLFPVAKVQWERFLAEPNSFGDAWYEEVLHVSPRMSLRKASRDDYEKLFISGVLPEEAEAFARWLGQDFQLPTAETWRAIERSLMDETVVPGEMDTLRADPTLHSNARKLVDFVVQTHRPRTWADFSFMRGGLLEWVRSGPKSFGGLGAPRQEFQPLLMNPQQHPPVKPLRNERLRYFGCRLVRLLTSGGSSP